MLKWSASGKTLRTAQVHRPPGQDDTNKSSTAARSGCRVRGSAAAPATPALQRRTKLAVSGTCSAPCRPDANSVPDAKEALRRLRDEASERAIPVVGRCPTFADYARRYLSEVSAMKRPATHRKERTQLAWWTPHMGALRAPENRRRKAGRPQALQHARLCADRELFVCGSAEASSNGDSLSCFRPTLP